MDDIGGRHTLPADIYKKMKNKHPVSSCRCQGYEGKVLSRWHRDIKFYVNVSVQSCCFADADFLQQSLGEVVVNIDDPVGSILHFPASVFSFCAVCVCDAIGLAVL